MADVRSLIGIDTGVLDENLVTCSCLLLASEDCLTHLSAVNFGIDVTGTGDLELLESRDFSQIGDHLFSYLAGSLAQLLGQFKREGECEFAHLNLGRLIH